MTTRLIQLFAAAIVGPLALSLSLTSPANAQVRVRDHRTVSVKSFSPGAGPAGTTITIQGKGFTSATRVLIGGQPVRAPVIRPKVITFRAPLRIGSGEIVLRHPGVANDISVGTFRLALSNPVIQSFSPRAGVPGTRVEIRGYGFLPKDIVMIGKVQAKAILVQPKRMIIVVPNGATTGRISTGRALKGVRHQTRKLFSIRLPAPNITSMKPNTGPPGTRVRLTVTSLTPRSKVFYGRRPIKIIARGPTFLDVMLPPRSRKARFFKVAGPNGQGRSPAKFRLQAAPQITHAVPAFGRPGTRVALNGGDFRAGDSILLNGRPLKLIQITAKRILVSIPIGARSARFMLARGTARFPSQRVFDVVYPPVITDIKPRGGAVGTNVTVMGSALASDVVVFYGAQRAKILSRKGESSVVIRVPRRAQDQFIKVRTRGGEAQSPSKFEVRVAALVRKLSPGAAFPGKQITIKGKNLDKVSAFYLNNVMLPFVSRKPRVVVLRLPATVTSGTIGYQSYRKRFKSRLRLSILARPSITSFSPRTGSPGTQVVIVGTNFDAKAKVFYNRRKLRLVRRASATRLVVRIPKRARASGFIEVQQRGERIRSAQQFRLIPPIAISGFTPKRSKVGSILTINGVGLDRVTRAMIGRWPATIVSRNPTLLRLRVPAARAKRRHAIGLMEGNVRVKTRAKIKILPSARIKTVAPRDTLPGAKVRITGKNFDAATKVFFGPLPMRVVRVQRRGKQLWAIVPARAQGNNFVFVDDHGVRSKSRKPLNILPPAIRQPPKRPAPRGPKPKIRVRDHR